MTALPLLSININKYALLRNSRGRNAPDLLRSADLCIAAGAHGITVHPRLDQRHVRLGDVLPLTEHLRAAHPGIEFNIECDNRPELLDLVCSARPDQCTLVPVRPGEVTSDHGFAPEDVAALRPSVERLVAAGVRVSAFVDCDLEHVRALAGSGVDRVELYTGPYAWAWGTEQAAGEQRRVESTARAAAELGLGLNAGHDLDRHNLSGLRGLAGLREVSIGHAQICRALEVGTHQAVRELLAALGHLNQESGR